MVKQDFPKIYIKVQVFNEIIYLYLSSKKTKKTKKKVYNLH